MLRVGVQGLPAGLDPYQELSNVGTRVTYSLFDHLLERDFIDGDPPGSGSEVLPMLAESWEREDDLTLVMNLRPGVTFHNGDPLTAEDIKFTFDRHLIDPVEELVDAQGYISTISDVEVVDDLTVRFHTAKPDPLLEIRLTSWATWILPKAYHEEVGIEGFAAAPIGTGPYKFVELRPDDALVLESHDGWWGGLPTAQRVEFRVIPETAARVAALVSGEVDIITNIDPDQVDSLDGASDVEVRSVPLANCHVIRYNTHHATMENKLLRQALNLAIDRELLVEALWGGRAVLMRGHQFQEYSGPIGGDQFNDERPYVPYDPDQARELLAESGYDGAEIVYRTAPSYYTFGAEAAQAIVQMWQDIGVNAKVEILENAYADGVEAIQVTNWSNSSFVADPDGAFWLRWGEPTASQRDFWTPENPRFNELGNMARETLDVETRFDSYQEMLDIWEDEAPGTVLYIPIENYGVRTNIDWLPYSFYYMDLRPKNLKING
ncbi:MAG: ABC transporter substrate-binding protein [Thermomicrobiales bacterium]